ncbi:MAG TPA: hypothetical protein H9961_07105 [Candidatus Duodenibacillus intestinavium]|nr:hypothetical protein [Candidatus Duodenibacillus intestinavium]
MASITVPNPYGQNVAIGPTNGLGGLHEAPETKYGLDKVVGGAAKEVAGAVDRWQDEIDRTNAKDAINKTQQQLRDLETNQENGWANILGENALKRPDGKSLVDEYQLKAKEVIDAQLSELKTSAARKYFERYAETAYQQNGNRLQTHLINQQKIYDKAVSAATIKTAQDDIRSGDLARMRSGFAVLEAEYQNLANKTGLPVDRYETVGAMHAIAIENFIDGKNQDAAAAWLDANKGSMSREQIRKARELIKAGQTTARADELAPKMIHAYGDSRAELLKKVQGIEDEDLREKVERRVRKQLAAEDQIKKAELKEATDQYWQFVDNDEEPPDSLIAQIKELAPGKWRQLRKAQRRTESDPKVLEDLTNMMFEDPTKFADLDLNEYAQSLTKKDQNDLAKLQKKMGDASWEAFEKDLGLRIDADKVLRKRRTEIIAAATTLWDEVKMSRPKGFIDKATSDMLIDRVLGASEWTWSKPNKDRGYQIINKRDRGVSAGQALAAADFENDATDQELNEILRRNGVTQKVTQEQANFARQIANGFGLPPEIMQQATEMAREAARVRGTKLTQTLINKTAEKIAFGQNQK